jgi:hypothetical protein
MTSPRFFAARAINRLQFGLALAFAVTVLSFLLPRSLWAEGPHATETSGLKPNESSRPINNEPKREPSSVDQRLYEPAAQDIADALKELNHSARVGEKSPAQDNFSLRRAENTAGEK